MRNLYIANNKEENFVALVLAKDTNEANSLLEEYSQDADLTGKWDLCLSSIKSVKNKVFDCDYLIQDSEFETDGVIYLEDVENFLFESKWNPKVFVATETDGFDTTTLVMVVEVADGVCFEQAAKLASAEYCSIKEGMLTYEGNCNCFNWGDFDTYVPNSICEKYGIRKIQSNVAGEFNFDQQLVEEKRPFYG